MISVSISYVEIDMSSCHFEIYLLLRGFSGFQFFYFSYFWGPRYSFPLRQGQINFYLSFSEIRLTLMFSLLIAWMNDDMHAIRCD